LTGVTQRPYGETTPTQRGDMSTFICDGCEQNMRTERVVFTTEVTDASGIDVEVTKRWTTCMPCAENVFSTIGRKAPWDDWDATTMAMPDNELHMGVPLGGISGTVAG
jgi:hypothetical protein